MSFDQVLLNAKNVITTKDKNNITPTPIIKHVKNPLTERLIKKPDLLPNDDVIDFITIATLGNALDFGDLTSQNGNKGTAASSPTRYVFHTQNNSNATIDFGTIAAKGNSTRFGDYISGGPGHPAAALLRCCSNQTRAVFAGGYLLISPYGFVTSQMGDITIASEGNATVFGDLTIARYGMNATSNQVRGIFAGGDTYNHNNRTDRIEFVTISTTGNSTDFGNLTSSRAMIGGASNSTRGLFFGGFTPSHSNTIDFITIATTGDATDFGDLITGRSRGCAAASSTRGITEGGSPGTNSIEFVEIATTGNAVDFGDGNGSGNSGAAACSNGHGGL